MAEIRVLLICDGSEMVRQRHADTVRFFENVVQTGVLAERVALTVVHEDGVDTELAGIVRDEYRCVIFASNALARTDGRVSLAVQRRATDLLRYVEGGGSLVILHQSLGSGPQELLGSALSAPVFTAPRTSFDSRWELQWSEDCSLTSHPNRLDHSRFAESEPGEWRSGFPLAYQTLSAEAGAGWRPVASAGDETLVMAHEGHGRVIVCSLPLDWAREVEFTQNLLVHAIYGLPTIVVVSPTEPPAPMRLDLARLTAYHPTLEITSFDDLKSLPSAHLSDVQLVIDLGDTERVPEDVRALLLRGGQLVRPSVSHGRDGTFRVLVELGPRNSVYLAQRALTALSELSLPEFAATAPIFDTRDLLVSLSPLFSALSRENQFMTLETALAIENRCYDWLSKGQSRVDQYTALNCLALAEFASEFAVNEGLQKLVVATLSSLPPQCSPEGRFLQAMLKERLHSRQHVESKVWEDLLEDVLATSLTVAGVVRVLDAVRTASALLHTPPDGNPHALDIADRCAQVLQLQVSAAPWISLESTAAIVDGLATLTAGKASNSVLEVLRTGTEPLVRALPARAEQTALVTHFQVAGALVRLEHFYASGLRDLAGMLSTPSVLVDEQANHSLVMSDLVRESENRLGAALLELSEVKRELDFSVNIAPKVDRGAILLGRATCSLTILVVTLLGLHPLLQATVQAVSGSGLDAYSGRDYGIVFLLSGVPLMIRLGWKYRLLLLSERLLPSEGRDTRETFPKDGAAIRG